VPVSGPSGLEPLTDEVEPGTKPDSVSVAPPTVAVNRPLTIVPPLNVVGAPAYPVAEVAATLLNDPA
jgi:hypothetical protein